MPGFHHPLSARAALRFVFGLPAVSQVLLLAACSPPAPSSGDAGESVVYAPGPSSGSVGGTSTQTTGASGTAAVAPDEPLPPPLLPDREGPWLPSFARLASSPPTPPDLSPLTLPAVARCEGCHAEITREWKDSVHAFSSFNNPLYRMTFDNFMQDNTPERANFCGGCHEPALTFNGRIQAPFDPTDVAAHSGITCATCHSIQEARPEGNASYVLRLDPIPVPVEGDPESLEAHRARVALPALRTEALCVSCHRGILSGATGHAAVMLGLDEWGPHRRSAFGDSHAGRISPDVRPQGCVDCHMPLTGTTHAHRGHRFAGGHSTLAAMIGSQSQQDTIESLLKTLSRLDILPPPPDAGSSPGLTFDVVVFNGGVGHRFPGGAKDLRDTWLEVTLHDSSGRLIAQSGQDHLDAAPESDAHVLNALVTDDTGMAETQHSVSHFRTPAYDHTLGPRDGKVVRYRLSASSIFPLESDRTAEAPWTLRVRLMHRRLTSSFHEAACEASRTPRGQQFLEATERHWKRRPNPCLEQPVLELTRSELALTSLSGAVPAPTTWAPYWRAGLAFQYQVQERLEEAEYSLSRAWELLPPDASALDRARIKLELARVAGELGRTDAALSMLEEAQGFAPGHPAIAFARGQSLAKVWRWNEAASAFALAAEGAPRDDRTWQQLALARGSAGDPRGALEAARRGLELEPRDPQLLRSQALAYRKLLPGDDASVRATEVYLSHRPDDDAPAIRVRCSDRSEDCRRERQPVHIHELRVAPATP